MRTAMAMFNRSIDRLRQSIVHNNNDDDDDDDDNDIGGRT